MYQGSNVQIGQTLSYHEDGANFTVKVLGKQIDKNEVMDLTLEIIEVQSQSNLVNIKAKPGDKFVASEAKNAGGYCGWSISPT